MLNKLTVGTFSDNRRKEKKRKQNKPKSNDALLQDNNIGTKDLRFAPVGYGVGGFSPTGY